MAAVEREPVTLSVVVVNPSAEKTQSVPVKIELPKEVTPPDVLERGELQLEYDEDRATYYVYKENVELEPKGTRIFEVVLKDLWFIPEEELDSLKKYTDLLLVRLMDTPYYETAKQLGDSVLQRLDTVAIAQNDETLSRKARIGAYRYNTQTIEQIKEDLSRMEKLLSFTGGTPVPEMMEESPLKADAPSKTTTWLVIFLIVLFIGLLGGQFFFTWHRRTQLSQNLHIIQQTAYPSLGRSSSGTHPQPKGNGVHQPAAHLASGGGIVPPVHETPAHSSGSPPTKRVLPE